ncbi:bifunctional glutamate N-acetyltransferase/amino-acid acetyltransferase ArgJ [Magnetofaba australis]|uniref:Arginine biosynthesis bifunctional protein ArgJ n=1 Tax=Magnetofaba australis IT-1 TaxID=1434232 RepID=A0A1Y2K5A3_9PROT|nr:bifunctional glutamate N-acetyltransferase/amino-acid acetyltransferase ArgJ [Magnetofaba australis]OSM02175.1 putative glutamate N-acetyltransferase [Magnetofaba australis IT-1]
MAVGAPPDLSQLPAVAGFETAATHCGIKKNGALDLLLARMAADTAVAGVFTNNRVVAAPVTLCRDHLANERAGALLVNSGNANACTGPQGMLNALSNARAVADLLEIPDGAVFLSSTGVIAEPLPAQKINDALPGLRDALAPGKWEAAARAIATTDTFPKGGARHVEIDGAPVTLVGIAKGSGMIHPDMATMLGYIFTDAFIAPRALQTLLERANGVSFNCISVDGDTSTNDTCMLFASGQAEHALIEDPDDPRAAAFAHALESLAKELAQWIVRDGEGASKFLTLRVTGAPDDAGAKQVAMSVARSSLVKTACAGSDPNWGRIIAAVGYAGVPFDPDATTIHLGEALIVERGGRAASYTEEMGQAVMKRDEIEISIDLGSGDGRAEVWSCDLTHEYVSINADYRT